ncbi:hypothetical protein GRI43_00525 [Altererythrobacter luteolus]|uniref:Lipopolysaccharide export system protein LptA n=1 Tax=Pontixanthobacter luteolus TaxID=295089 RepID=A0A6I4UYJ8_9SPHN|nr:hypothetical protein [Pontixanthobacter luteolus]MXP45876.1 hypothetical protein [Pontixanthobacter luteolus]
MRKLSFIFIGVAAAMTSGAVVGTSIDTDPLARKTRGLEAVPQHGVSLAVGHDDVSRLSPPPGHVSVMKVNGEVRHTARADSAYAAAADKYFARSEAEPFDQARIDGYTEMRTEDGYRLVSNENNNTLASTPALSVHPLTGKSIDSANDEAPAGRDHTISIYQTQSIAASGQTSGRPVVRVAERSGAATITVLSSPQTSRR